MSASEQVPGSEMLGELPEPSFWHEVGKGSVWLLGFLIFGVSLLTVAVAMS